MANESTGAYRVFVGKAAFSATEVDSVYGAALPVATSTTPFNWLQLKTKGAATLSRSGETLDLENDQDGLIDVVISARDDWSLKFDITEIDNEHFFNLLGLTPDAAIDFDTPGTVKNIQLNNAGVSMLTNGFPVFFYRKQFDAINNTDDPKVDTGSDPLAWAFAKGVIADRALELSYDATGQLVASVTLKPVAVDGTTNKGVAIVHGAFTAEA